MNEKSRIYEDIPCIEGIVQEVQEQVYVSCVLCGGPQLIEIRYPVGYRPSVLSEITCYGCYWREMVI